MKKYKKKKKLNKKNRALWPWLDFIRIDSFFFCKVISYGNFPRDYHLDPPPPPSKLANTALRRHRGSGQVSKLQGEKSDKIFRKNSTSFLFQAFGENVCTILMGGGG